MICYFSNQLFVIVNCIVIIKKFRLKELERLILWKGRLIVNELFFVYKDLFLYIVVWFIKNNCFLREMNEVYIGNDVWEVIVIFYIEKVE